MEKLYLVLTIEEFAGDEGRFFTETKLFTARKDAEDYWTEQDQEFCRLHRNDDDDDDEEHVFTDDEHYEDVHEYWWHGTSHHRSEIIEIEPK